MYGLGKQSKGEVRAKRIVADENDAIHILILFVCCFHLCLRISYHPLDQLLQTL
jgi:hypothetical protein